MSSVKTNPSARVGQPLLDPLELDAALQEWLPRAEASDHLAEAYVAIIRYLSDPAPSSTTRDEINNWLRKALTSDDPEFLISLAEELVFATAIYRDIDLARDFFQRALSLSPLQGSYAMARFVAAVNRKSCIENLTRAANLGHVPSKRLLIASQRAKNRFVRAAQAIRYFPGLYLDIRKGIGGTANREYWWRYKDFVKEKLWDELSGDVRNDRKKYFAWARPTSFSEFALARAKEQSVKTARSRITTDLLTPKAVSSLQLEPEVTRDSKMRNRRRRARIWLVCGMIYIAWVIYYFVSSSASPSAPVVRNPSAMARVEVSIQQKDGSMLSKTFRPEDFATSSGSRSIRLSEKPVHPGEFARSALLTLEAFDGWDGRGLIRVQSNDKEGATLEVTLPGYEQCTDVPAFEQPAGIKICIKQARS